MFELVKNPFVVLGVNPRSTKADIHEAVEDALLDAENIDAERCLEIARQTLIAPNERLHAELSYLLEMRPAEARKAVASRQFDEWLAVADANIGLSRVNAIVQAIATKADNQNAGTVFERMFDSWTEISEAEIVTRINEDRSVAGFSEVQRKDVRQGLDELRDFHASQLLQGFDREGQLPYILTDLLTRRLVPEGRMGEKFASTVIDLYSRHFSGALANAADRALHSLETFAANVSDADFEEFEEELEQWDEIAQPLQLAHESKGADEAHSKELYEKIRATAFSLANDEDRHHEALRITKLSKQVFAELPWAAEALIEDARALNDIIANKTKNKLLVPLATALNEAREDLYGTSKKLSSHGFSSDAPDPIGAMHRGYANLLSNDTDREIRDIGANMVRNLSIALFNEREEALQAKMLTSQLAADEGWFSADVRMQILADDEQLACNLQLERVMEAAKREDWKLAKERYDELIKIPSASEIPDLRKIEDVIDEKLRAKKTSLVVWGSIAAVVLGVIVFSDNNSTSDNSNYEYDAAMDETDTAEFLADEADAVTELPTIGEVVDSLEENDALNEEMPPTLYSAGVLSMPELRYCLRQGERLDLASNMVANSTQQSRFNSAVTNFNSRCGTFRYDTSDMATARSEIANMRGQLLSEAQDIVGTNTSVQVPSYTAPSSNSLGTNKSVNTNTAGRTAEDPRATDSSNPYDDSNEEYP